MDRNWITEDSCKLNKIKMSDQDNSCNYDNNGNSLENQREDDVSSLIIYIISNLVTCVETCGNW